MSAKSTPSDEKSHVTPSNNELQKKVAANPSVQLESWTSLFKLLGDESRIRILSLLAENEVAVGELQKVLGLGQSTLSTHLSLLKEPGLVLSRKEGQKVFYRLSVSFDKSSEDERYGIVQSVLESAKNAKWFKKDQKGLFKILKERADSSLSFFNNAKAPGDAAPGQTWEALASGLLSVIRGKKILDLGCGQGKLACLLASEYNEVTGLDSSRVQIEGARQRALEEGLQVRFMLGDFGDTGLPDAHFDMVILSHALHHAPNPKQLLRESSRLLKPGGAVLILDLNRHEEEWLQKKYGDFWMGFEPKEIESWLIHYHFENMLHKTLSADESEPSLEPICITATKKL